MKPHIPQSLYSLLYYTSVSLVFFRKIEPSEHYLENHQHQMRWEEVVERIFKTKNPKKKGNKFIIEDENTYILFEIKNQTLWVINAKRP